MTFWGLGGIVFVRSIDVVRDDFSITDHGAQLFIVPGTCCRVFKKYRLSSRHRRVKVCIGGLVSSANDYS